MSAFENDLTLEETRDWSQTLSCAQKVIKQRILAISWNDVKITLLFITVYLLKRFVIKMSFSYTNLSLSVEALQGYLVDWDAQKAVWDGVFSSEVLNVRPPCGSGWMSTDLAPR